MMITERILVACNKMRAKGYRIEARTWGVGWNAKRNKWAPLKSAGKRLCPLGAVVLAEQPPPGRYQSVPEAVSALLGVSMLWVVDFQCACDGVAKCVSAGSDAATTVFRSLEALPSEGAPPASGASAAEEA